MSRILRALIGSDRQVQDALPQADHAALERLRCFRRSVVLIYEMTFRDSPLRRSKRHRYGDDYEMKNEASLIRVQFRCPQSFFANQPQFAASIARYDGIRVSTNGVMTSTSTLLPHYESFVFPGSIADVRRLMD